jgi:hypothetical protein
MRRHIQGSSSSFSAQLTKLGGCSRQWTHLFICQYRSLPLAWATFWPWLLSAHPCAKKSLGYSRREPLELSMAGWLAGWLAAWCCMYCTVQYCTRLLYQHNSVDGVNNAESSVKAIETRLWPQWSRKRRETSVTTWPPEHQRFQDWSSCSMKSHKALLI